MHKSFIASITSFNLPKNAPLVVACSGGADSMALTLLLREYCQKSGNALTAVTVDHGLRKESASEAKQVGQWLKKHGIAHAVLTWKGKKPTSNIQEAARKARYALLTEHCHTHNSKYLLVAHTREDQAETFLLRLARGSGVDGLSCMSPVSAMNGITLLRPLLNVTKAELIHYLKTKKQKWIDDPSNKNAKYDRIKMRQALPMLAGLGLTVEKLAATAQAMERARQCLEAETNRILSQHCTFFDAGYAILLPFAAPDEIALRVVAKLVMSIGGHEVKPRLEETEQLLASLRHKSFKGATLGGCQFIAHKEKILICRELSAVQKPAPVGNIFWDNRYAITCPAKKGWTVGALTQTGWLAIAKCHALSNPYPDKRILYTLPTLRDEKGNIQAVPHLGLSESGEFSVRLISTPVIASDQRE